jgi:phosphatidylglycerophosphate synthase
MPEGAFGIDKFVYTKLLNDKLPCWLEPNTITLTALLMLVPVLWALEARALVVAGVLIMVRCLLDMADGSVARSCGKVSTTGAIFDAVGDVIFHVGLAAYVLYQINKLTVLNLTILICIGTACANVECLSNNLLIIHAIEALSVYALLRSR